MTDSELNELVAEKVMGWQKGRANFTGWWVVPTEEGYHCKAHQAEWDPINEMGFAWRVVEKLREYPVILEVFVSLLAARASRPEHRYGALEWLLKEADMPREWCLAALRAHGVEVPECH